ncbi:DUF2244 domain-containing protein [Stagnimonas aquatica]|nr:DUF2244 domain-containing protein [Stagnimonas aquatica]
MHASDTRLVIGPNASLSPRQALLFMALVCSAALPVAIGFALVGLWPILPFAGLELGALALALWVSLRRNRYREVIDFEADRVRVGYGWMQAGAVAQIDWPRVWTRVELLPGGNRHQPSQLRLRQAGQILRLGRCLTDEERERLHRRLKELLPPVWSYTPAEESERNPTQEVLTGG